MQTLDLFLGKNYIYQPQCNKLLKVRQESEDVSNSIPALTSALSTFLTHIDLSTSGRINIIIDHTLSSQFSFNLPFLSKKKLNKIVEYELDQILLDGAELSYYNYYTRPIKETGVTEVTGYLAEKKIIDEIISVVKEKGGEVRRVLSQNNLLDLQNMIQQRSDDHIYIKCNMDAVRIFAYVKKTLKGIFVFPLSRDKYDRNQFDYILEELVKIVDAVRLSHPEISQIYLSAEAKKVMDVSLQNELQFRNDLGDKLFSFRSINRKALISPSCLNRSECLNLLKDNIYFIREIKKNIPLLKYTASILIGFFIFYSTSVIYNSYQLTSRQGQLERKLNQTIRKYLPQGASKSNAVFILDEKLAQVRSTQSNKEVYEHRSYRVLGMLKKISGLKEEIEGIKIRKMIISPQSVTLQGELKNAGVYEVLSGKISLLFPEDQYRVRMNQKTSGNQSSFSVRSTLKNSPSQ